MKLSSENFNHGDSIPSEFAFCVTDPVQHVALADNKNPHLVWTDVPAGTKSFVLLCVDGDVPTVPDDVNQEDREVPSDLARTDFYHWVMVDIPNNISSIAAGSCSDKVTAHGKQNPNGPPGSRQGINDYTNWFNGDAAMQGNYFGYDGPCPPWNDSIIHHYRFTLYATDLDKCDVAGAFTGEHVKAAIKNHVLAEASLVATYTLNPRLL